MDLEELMERLQEDFGDMELEDWVEMFERIFEQYREPMDDRECLVF